VSCFGFSGQPNTPWLTGLFQVESEVPYSAPPGPATGASQSEWGSRDTFLGVKGDWGAFKIGKDDACYQSTPSLKAPAFSMRSDKSIAIKKGLLVAPRCRS